MLFTHVIPASAPPSPDFRPPTPSWANARSHPGTADWWFREHDDHAEWPSIAHIRAVMCGSCRRDFLLLRAFDSFPLEAVARDVSQDELEEALRSSGCLANGGGLCRSNFRKRAWLPAVAARVGSPCDFHDLRHSHAALLIREGLHPKVIQERMGHASIRTTLDTYGHLFPGLDEAAADALDASARGVGVGLGPSCSLG